MNSFKKTLLETTKIKVLFQDTNGWKQYFEMGEYGLLRTKYNPKDNLTGFDRILDSPFKILDMCSENNRTFYRIELLLEKHKGKSNEIIEVESFNQFKKELDYSFN